MITREAAFPNSCHINARPSILCMPCVCDGIGIRRNISPSLSPRLSETDPNATCRPEAEEIVINVNKALSSFLAPQAVPWAILYSLTHAGIWLSSISKSRDRTRSSVSYFGDGGICFVSGLPPRLLSEGHLFARSFANTTLLVLDRPILS